MLTTLTSFLRERMHLMWRLRQISAFRRFQNRFDVVVYTRLPKTGIRVAVKLLRDASWVFAPENLDLEMHRAFALIVDVLKPGVFWDIGANLGFYSWFVRRFPCVREVIMFEPDPINFDLITRTIRKNGITDCRPLNVALSDNAGEASFLVDRASGATGSLESAAPPKENKASLHHQYAMDEVITCRTETIDNLISQGASPPDIIKIDVEGTEHLVLAGGKVFLARHQPVMLIETANSDLASELEEAGYSIFRIDIINLLLIPPGVDSTPFRSAFPGYERIS